MVKAQQMEANKTPFITDQPSVHDLICDYLPIVGVLNKEDSSKKSNEYAHIATRV